MRLSQLFGKALKKAPREAETISHKLLIRGGFIDHQLSAGIYSFLPLGWRVHRKIEKIIREEMNAIGGQEVFLPTLQPKEIWLKSERWEKMDPPLLKLKDRHEREFALGPTHEESLPIWPPVILNLIVTCLFIFFKFKISSAMKCVPPVDYFG